MSTTELKAQFHKLIDETEDSDFLQNSFNMFLVHRQKKDVLDFLTESQKAGLYEAIEQVKTGEVVSNKIVSQKMQQKIDQCFTK